jgi:hypothetical protein
MNAQTRYSTHGLALVVAERLTKETGVAHTTRFAPQWPGDDQPFLVVRVVNEESIS